MSRHAESDKGEEGREEGAREWAPMGKGLTRGKGQGTRDGGGLTLTLAPPLQGFYLAPDDQYNDRCPRAAMRARAGARAAGTEWATGTGR